MNDLLSEDQKSIYLSRILDDLSRTHYAWDNFHNEPPYVKMILDYVKESPNIPITIRKPYVETIITCRSYKKCRV